MGAFNINITGVGGHGCERKAKPGEKLHRRCGRFNCPDCMAYEFVQQLRQRGMLSEGQVACTEVFPSTIREEDYRSGFSAGWAAGHAAAVHADQTGHDGGKESVGLFFSNQVPDDSFIGSDGKRYVQHRHSATFTHWPHSQTTVVDDMLRNERKSGQF